MYRSDTACTNLASLHRVRRQQQHIEGALIIFSKGYLKEALVYWYSQKKRNVTFPRDYMNKELAAKLDALEWGTTCEYPVEMEEGADADDAKDITVDEAVSWPELDEVDVDVPEDVDVDDDVTTSTTEATSSSSSSSSSSSLDSSTGNGGSSSIASFGSDSSSSSSSSSEGEGVGGDITSFHSSSCDSSSSNSSSSSSSIPSFNSSSISAPRAGKKRKKNLTQLEKLQSAVNYGGKPVNSDLVDPTELRAQRSRAGRASKPREYLSFNHRNLQNTTMLTLFN
jgi:hypothetical protein